MDKLSKELKAIQIKSIRPDKDVKALLDKCYTELDNITDIIVIVEYKKGGTGIVSSLDYPVVIAELETAKTYLVNKRLRRKGK